MKAGLNASEKVGKKVFLSEKNVGKVSHEHSKLMRFTKVYLTNIIQEKISSKLNVIAIVYLEFMIEQILHNYFLNSISHDYVLILILS